MSKDFEAEVADDRGGWCCTSCRDAVARSNEGPIVEDPWEDERPAEQDEYEAEL